jgi:hypothetical protein
LKKKFEVAVNITKCQGWQSWIVEAEDEAEAKAKWEKGEGEFDCEEINVTSLDRNSITIREIKEDNEGENDEEPTGFILSEN